MGRVITLTGTPSIQRYVFGTNRLRENVGASLLVTDGEEWWKEHVPKKEKLFVGGGNAAFTSKDMVEAHQRVFEWSSYFLRNAPGLPLAAAHVEYQDGHLAEEYLEARKRLAEIELTPQFAAPLGALAVSKICPSTAGPAECDLDDQWLSQEAARKREKEDRYSKSHPEFPRDIGKLDNDGSAHAALCHIDGDNTGERFRHVALQFQGKPDQDFQCAIKRESEKIKDLVANVLKVLKEDLLLLKPDLLAAEIIDYRYYHEGDKLIPFRELVRAGDDVTILTPGRLGLSVTARYLDLFEKMSVDVFKPPITSSAGVLVMPSKFPFSRGYVLTGSLAENAKKARREVGLNHGSWIDFQVVLEGTTGTLEQIRESYTFGNNRLLQRPYRLDGPDASGWKSFEQLSEAFGDIDKWPRSQAKRLLETLARGTNATQDLIKEFKVRQRRLPGPYSDPWLPSAEGTKTVTRTPYFDPLEMLDFHVAVDWEKHVLKEKVNVPAAH